MTAMDTCHDRRSDSKVVVIDCRIGIGRDNGHTHHGLAAGVNVNGVFDSPDLPLVNVRGIASKSELASYRGALMCVDEVAKFIVSDVEFRGPSGIGGDNVD